MPLDSIAVLSLLDRATDANGAVVPGATLEFSEAGTTTPMAVYSDADLTVSLGAVVTCDAGGYPTSDGNTQVSIYTGTASYKVVVKNSSGVTVLTRDNIPGAPVIPTDDAVALPETPVVSRTSTYVILTTDQGKLINADPTSGSFSLTLPSAITAGDGWRIGVRHAGNTSNTITVRTTGGQTISCAGQSSATSHSLTGRGHTRWYVSDGASGYTVDAEVSPLMSGPLPFFRVADRLTAPPASPVGGARYIINGTPTGAWSTLGFAEEDVAEYDGNGSWFRYTPGAGWFAYVVDEDLFTKYDGSSWEDQTGMGAPSSSTLKRAIYEHQASSGTGGGTNTNGSWATRPLTTEVVDSIGGSVASNEVTLPVGTYLVTAQQQLYQEAGTLGSTGIAQQRLTAVTATFDALYLGMPTRNGGVAAGAGVSFTSYNTHTLNDHWLLNVTVAGTVKLEYHTNWSTTNSGLGVAASNGVEVFARLTIIDLASLQGPQGIQGIQGEGGLDAAYAYQWSTATSGDPGSGKMWLNNATYASATQWAISETDALSSGLAAAIATWDDSSSTTFKARVRIHKEGSPGSWIEFKITGTGTDQGTYWTFPISGVISSGTLSTLDSLALIVIPNGDIGDPGTTVPDPSGLSAHSDFNDETDYVVTYDTSAGATKKSLGKNLGFTQAGTGAVLRRLQEKLRDRIDARDFGVSASASSSNNRTFMQAALDYVAGLGRATLLLPDFTFDMAGSVTLSANNCGIVGTGKASSLIVQKTVSSPTFVLSGDRQTAHHFGVYYDSAGTAGGDAFQFTGEYLNALDLWAVNAYRGYVYSGANQSITHDVESANHVVNGMLFDSIVGGKFTNCQMNAGIPTNASLGNVRMTNQVEALLMANIECLEGKYSLTTDATAPGFGARPAWNRFVDFYCDAASDGSVINHMYGSKFIGSWFSGGRSGGGLDGVTLSNCLDVAFVECQFANCGKSGAKVNATSSKIRFFGGAANSNSVTAGSGVGHGIEIAANTNDVTVLYPEGGNDLVPGGQQGYDVYVAAGTSGRVVVKASGSGGVTGVAQHNGTGTGNVVEINGTLYQGGSIIPFANDGGAIGASGQAMSDGFWATGAVQNYGAGNVTQTHSTGKLVTKAVNGIGYDTGSGGAVTQATSRTTGVTVNAACGAITLVSAAGSTTAASFTVTNSAVAATDTVIVSQKSGTDKYDLSVTAVGAGSFEITFKTHSGTTVEQPVFNFVVIKAVAA